MCETYLILIVRFDGEAQSISEEHEDVRSPFLKLLLFNDDIFWFGKDREIN